MRARLVTLIGVGGVGKTRLALQVAAEVLPRFRDGVWLCELAAVDEPEALRQVIAATLGVQPRPGTSVDESLVEFLRGKHALLVLDNCEHLLRAAAHLATAILRECPTVHVLATSRESLGVAGEQAWPLSSLDIPESAAFEDIGGADSVRLFVDRADAARPGFELQPANAEAVAEICRRLDGIPLAIELAAARVAAMSPREISGLLDQRFRLLTGGRRSAVERHQTLRATVDWSYSLLGERERAVFDRLGVFTGSFDARAAQTIVAGDGVEAWDVLDSLTDLVAKSMIVAEETDEGITRYQLLETLRQYAREQLDEAGSTDAWRRRHAAHYADHAEELGPLLEGPAELAWWKRLLDDLDNMRAAVDMVARQRRLGRHRVCDANLRGDRLRHDHQPVDGRRRVARTRAERADESTPARRAVVLAYASGYAAHHQGDLAWAQELCRSALRDGVPAGAPAATVAHATLSVVAVQTGQIEEARRWIAEGHLALDAIGDDAYYRVGLHELATLWALWAHDFDAARAEADAGLRLARANSAIRAGSPRPRLPVDACSKKPETPARHSRCTKSRWR